MVFNNWKNTVNPKENIPVVGKRIENLHESVLIHALKPHLSNCNYSKRTIERRNFFRWLNDCRFVCFHRQLTIAVDFF